VSNRLTLLLFALALIYTTATMAKGLPIYIVPLSGLPVCILIIALNYYHKHHTARLIASIAPMLITNVYHAAAMQNGEDPITASYIMGSCFVIIPFVLFDLEEKVELLLSVITCTLILLSVRYLNNYIDIPFDSSFARTAKYEFVIIILTVFIVSLIMLVLLQTNKRAILFSEKLVEEVKNQNESLKTSQVELKEYVVQAEANKKKDRERSWEANSLAAFTELLRGENDLHKISDLLLSKVVKSLEANQAALYIIQERDHEKFLKGISCYAHERKRFFEKEILIGEGVVGQSFFEKETIYMTDIPNNYFEITSGLGKSFPKSLLAVPLIANEETIGVIEIASFHEIENYQKQFIEKLGENIASVFYNIQNNKRTEELLKEVQHLNKDYQKQEKELTKKIERLKSEKREVEYREQMLIEKIKKLEDTFGK